MLLDGVADRVQGARRDAALGSDHDCRCRYLEPIPRDEALRVRAHFRWYLGDQAATGGEGGEEEEGAAPPLIASDCLDGDE
ncbi:MAG: hypothetical protein WCP59_15075, partial [Actinomycetota bacterium]